MNNKNLLLAAVLFLGLMGLHSFIMQRYYPQKEVAVAQQAPSQPVTPPPAPTPVVPTSPAPLPASLDKKAVVNVESAEWLMTFRKYDGAIIQAVWKKDGTPLFPEQKLSNKKQMLTDFAGLGGAANTVFDGEPKVTSEEKGQSVAFSNTLGETLVYHIPHQGHVFSVDWQSPKANRLVLVRRPSDEFAAAGMNRVFSFHEKSFDSVEWVKTIKEPWFGKKKEIPPADKFVGVDAGVEPSQRNFYFAAIWDAMGRAERDPAQGYFLSGGQPANLTLYLGPKQSDHLAAFAKPCKQVMDFGFFGVVAELAFMILMAIHSVIGNWGWTIVVFGIIIRLALWPLNTKTTIQSLRMKELEPHQKVIQAKYEKFGSDMQKKAEMQKELMAFYKKNGHNPMGGCLPMLMQMPVLMALWSMFGTVFELRHAPWMLWIQDLSQPDKLYALPLLLAGSMVVQSLMSPPMGDPTQRKMMMFMMPVMMGFMFSSFPSGLNLYYLVFNLVGLLQIWWVSKHYKPQPVVI